MADLYKHKQIRDLTYEVIGTTKKQDVHLREIQTGRRFTLTHAEFVKNYEKK